MFIELSAGRRRAVRWLFLAAGVLPCALLAAVAWWWHSAGHVAALEREASAHLGVPVSIGRVEHPRPGVLRLSSVGVGGATGVVVPEIEVEIAAAEVRLRLPRIEFSSTAARAAADIVADWLRTPERFPKSWVVDVESLAWVLDDDARVETAGGWHVECVAANGERAVRLRAEPASADEIRVRCRGGACEVEAVVERPLPASVVAAVVAGVFDRPVALGQRAVVHGRLGASCGERGWAGRCSGGIEHCDLSAAIAGVRPLFEGDVRLDVAALEFFAGRLTQGDLRISSEAGAVAQEVLESLVSRLGCRPGPAYRSLAGDGMRRFDDLSCRMTIDARGLEIGPLPSAGAGLISFQGLNMIEGPTGPMPAARLAWLFAPADRPSVPATPVSAWLISLLPEHGPRADGF